MSSSVKRIGGKELGKYDERSSNRKRVKIKKKCSVKLF